MLTHRLGFDNQKNPDYIRSLLEVIGEHPGSCDEIWLATDYGYPSLDAHRESAKRLAVSAQLIREAGIRVSLQISNTVGHGEYMGVRDCSGLVYDGSPAERFVDINGTEAPLSFCYHGPHFRAYLREMLTVYCQAIKPHRVWVDDDFRFDHHSPAGMGCLCDRCLERFCHRYGVSVTREELPRLIAVGDSVWRERFVGFLRDGLCDLAEDIAKTVVATSPQSSVGLQHGSANLPAPEDYQALFQAFARGSGKPVGSRPGAGTYNDHIPGDMLLKSDSIRYQASLVAGTADEIRPEIENFPHVCFGKSPAGTCYETSVYFASGANAMSYATLMYDFEPLEWHGELFRGLAAHRAYWEKLVAINAESYEAGLTQYLPPDLWQRSLHEQDAPFRWCDIPWYHGNTIRRCGIPISYRADTPHPLYMLPCEVARGLSDADIEDLLSYPVFCGGDTLAYLAERGFGDRFSAEAHGCSTLKLFERFTDDDVNPAVACRRWENGLMQSWGHYLIDRNGKTRVLGYYDTDGKGIPHLMLDKTHPYGISSAIVETSKNAKWLVLGQYPWTPVISWAKRQQILSALDVISDRRLSAISEGRHQVVLFPREDADCRTVAVTVLNTTVGEADGVILRIRRPSGQQARVYCPDGSCLDVPSVIDGGDMVVDLPSILPWNVCTVVCDR